MKLTSLKRLKDGKNAALKLRRAGLIPAVLYDKGKTSLTIAIKEEEWQTVLRKIKKGRLATTVLTLVDETGKEKQALVKDIQYDSISSRVIHLDFEELIKDGKIKVKVPIECTGVVECVGIKLGGVFRQSVRHLPVICSTDKIPQFFQLDVAKLGLQEFKRLSDIVIPEGVCPLKNLKEMAVVIAKR